MAQSIGYQDGITAAINRLRTSDPGGTIVKKGPDGKWPKEPLETIKDVPLENWKAWDKLERTLGILAYDHDQAVTPSPLPPVDPPVDPHPQPSGFAPQSYNKGSRGQNAKFNVRINCTYDSRTGEYVDGQGVRYDDAGLCKGGRTEPNIPGLKPSDMSDGKEPWESYEWMGQTFPPYPAQSYEK